MAVSTGVVIGGKKVTVTATGATSHDGRQVYRWQIGGWKSKPGGEIRSGVGARVDVKEALGTLLSFLEAAAEEYRSDMSRPGQWHEDEPLFPKPIMEWAYMNDDDIQMANMELRGDEGDDRRRATIRAARRRSR